MLYFSKMRSKGGCDGFKSCFCSISDPWKIEEPVESGVCRGNLKGSLTNSSTLFLYKSRMIYLCVESSTPLWISLHKDGFPTYIFFDNFVPYNAPNLAFQVPQCCTSDSPSPELTKTVSGKEKASDLSSIFFNFFNKN